MTETSVIVACTERGVWWFLDAESAKCPAPGHEHRRHEVHRHRDNVVLPDGVRIGAVSFHPLDPYARDRQPDFGLYFDRRWTPPWPHAYLDWPDYGAPDDPKLLRAALRSVFERARAGETVEMGCVGGHGRTGTALACLAFLTGLRAADAVAWVRAHYCPQAVETAAQEEFITALAGCQR